jgi:hypothetical protein
VGIPNNHAYLPQNAVSKVSFVMQVLGGRRSEEVSKGKQKLKRCEVLIWNYD